MRSHTSPRFSAALLAVVAAVTVIARPPRADAIINQVDGTIVPVSTRLQTCLDKPATASAANPAPGDGLGSVDAIRDASIYPQTFTPAVRSDGRRIVSFTMVAEGGGFRNRFGWYNVGDTPFTTATRHPIYSCRDANLATGCACPCTAGPRTARPADTACTHWVNQDIAELDFDCFAAAGTWRRGPVAFYIMTPETTAPCTVAADCTATHGPTAYCRASRCIWGDSTNGIVCPPADATDTRIYSTDNVINDDGDYLHFLIYQSRAFSDAFYFGWEDLFRGGDNDFEDVLIRSVGLVPACHAAPEACDGRDNDCDGLVDEDVASAGPCGVSVGECRAGMFVCERGAFVCRGVTGPSTETCDGLDNDCDGTVDNGNPGGGGSCTQTPEGVPYCSPGTMNCRAGRMVCEGGTPGRPEVCDCEDNNCDGRVDEMPGTGSLCEGGGACIACGCRTPCAAGEFPCSLGLVCRDGFCVPPLCGTRVCRDSEACVNDACVDACSITTCQSGTVCRTTSGVARCVEDNCYGLGCASGQVCRQSACVDDPCLSVSCGPLEFCRSGTCIHSCGEVRCHAGAACHDGQCVPDACYGVPCLAGSICREGACVEDACQNVGCGTGRVCRDGACVDNPCANVQCPNAPAVTCIDGECVRPGVPPLTERDRVVATGGGGTSCAARPGLGTASGRAAGLAVTLALAALFAARRRRRHGARAARAVLCVSGAVLALAGCSTEPYCLNCADSDTQSDSSGRDVSTIPINCTPTGNEVCDSVDNDCDGETDEDFDLQTDPRNCGVCARDCSAPHAIPACRAGTCGVRSCDLGYYDLDGDASNGCEYVCMRSGDAEVCNGMDDNCNGQTDEGFDLQTDATHCGRCNNACRFTQAAASCAAGACVMGACQANFVDLDHNPATGCEYACRASGTEVCDRVDNDCDGMVDEDGACLRLFPASDLRIDQGVANSLAPVITGDGTGTLGVAYMDLRDSPTPDSPLAEIFFTRSTDNGGGWLADRRVDHGARAARDAIRPSLAWNGNRAVVVWGDFRTSSSYREVWSNASSDDGATWSAADVRANTGTDDSFGVRVAMNSRSIVAVWEELQPDRSRRVNAARSTDNGMTWAASRVDHAPAARIATAPAVALVGSNVFVAWQDNRNGQTDVYLNRSTDTGATWRATDTRMDTDAAGSHSSERVDVAADDTGHVIVAWQDVRNASTYDIFSRVSTDNAVSFAAADVRLDTTPFDTDSIHPSVVSVAAGRYVVIWQDNRWGRPNLYARSTGDGGATWSTTDTQIMGARGASTAVDFSAAAAGSTVYVAWSDDRSGQLDLYANYSPDGGVTFQPTDVRLDTGAAGAASSETPSIYAALSGGVPMAHVVWVDRRGDGILGDIYYRSIRP